MDLHPQLNFFLKTPNADRSLYNSKLTLHLCQLSEMATGHLILNYANCNENKNEPISSFYSIQHFFLALQYLLAIMTNRVNHECRELR